MARFERLVRPRWQLLTRSAAANAVHGGVLVLAGVLLAFPLGLVPFSNTLPALGILGLSLGIWNATASSSWPATAMTAATIVYFAALAVGALLAGPGILSLMGG